MLFGRGSQHTYLKYSRNPTLQKKELSQKIDKTPLNQQVLEKNLTYFTPKIGKENVNSTLFKLSSYFFNGPAKDNIGVLLCFQVYLLKYYLDVPINDICI